MGRTALRLVIILALAEGLLAQGLQPFNEEQQPISLACFGVALGGGEGGFDVCVATVIAGIFLYVAALVPGAIRVDGGWTQWSNSACSVTCGKGTLTNTRSCTNPSPSWFGIPCQGSDKETITCNMGSCPGTVTAPPVELACNVRGADCAGTSLDTPTASDYNDCLSKCNDNGSCAWFKWYDSASPHCTLYAADQCEAPTRRRAQFRGNFYLSQKGCPTCTVDQFGDCASDLL